MLPARRGQACQVALAPYSVRPNAATSRITSGDRPLVIAESGGVIEVFADRQDLFAVTPEIVVDASRPDPAAALAARVLASVLPRLERETANVTVHTHGWHQVIIDKAAELNEVWFTLIDHGARPAPVPRGDGVGIEWMDRTGAEWGLWILTPTGNFTLSYAGPVGGPVRRAARPVALGRGPPGRRRRAATRTRQAARRTCSPRSSSPVSGGSVQGTDCPESSARGTS